MKLRRPNFGLRVTFALTLAGMVFIVAGLLSFLIGQSSVDQLQARIGQSLATDAARIADRLNKEMAARSRELALLAAMDPLRNQADPAAMQSLLDSLRRNEGDYLWLAVTDLQGHVVTATDGSLLGNDLSNHLDLRDLLRGGARADDAQRMIRAGGDPARLDEPRLITINRPIRSLDGTVVGLIAAQLSWDWARELSHALLTADADGVVRRQTYIVANNDIVLIGPPKTPGTRLTLPAVNRARAGIVGWSVADWPGGESFVVGSGFAAGEGQFPGPGTVAMGWTVLVRESQDAWFAPGRQLRNEILASGLALSFVFAVLGWIIVGYITRPLRRIAAAADRLRLGENVELPHIRGAAEIETLSASLRALVATLSFKQLKLDEMETTAQHDGLTGLMNRAGLNAWLSRAVARSRTEPTGLLVLVGDLDGFKQVNDTWGHSAGDALLREVANRLRASVRANDGVARLGGDEFVLVLNAPLGAADRAAVETAYRVWSRVIEPYQIVNKTVTVGFSLGGAGWPEDDRQLDGVLNKADSALYAAKRAGKGQVVFYREPVLG